MKERPALGIDFGTTNSAAATFDGTCVRWVELELREPVMPTALYLTKKLSGKIGRAAIDAYIRDNAGRKVELVQETVGAIEVTVSLGGIDEEAQEVGSTEAGGSHTDLFAVHAYTDAALPGRLFRSVKRWLGDDRLERVKVFDRAYRIVALITPVLQHIVETGGESAPIYVGRPVHFEGRSDRADRTATGRLCEACRHAGIAQPVLYPEPIAAALADVVARAPARDELLLAFDFGGGTLDLTVVRARGSALDVLATHGISLGGDAIDRMIYERWVFPALGCGLTVPVPVDAELMWLPFDFSLFADGLLSWPLAYQLNRSELRERIVQGMRAGPDARARLSRLYRLIAGNHAYSVIQAIERAKVELSSAESTRVCVREIDLDLEIRRADLEEALAPRLRAIHESIDVVLELAGIDPGRIARVVRTGGSSCIPVVRELLDRRFPGRVVERDPFRSVAAGLAIAAHRRLDPPEVQCAVG